MTSYLVDPQELLGLAEMSNRFDVPYSTALSWTRTRGFPEPRRVFKMGAAWLAADVQAWREARDAKKGV